MTDRFPAWREVPDCIWCHQPLMMREFIRPGGIPTYYRTCDCEGAELLMRATP